MRSVQVLVPLFLSLVTGGCSRYATLHYASDPRLNAVSSSAGQPLQVAVYQLRRPPPELARAPCDTFLRPETVDSLVQGETVSKDVVTFVPDQQRGSTRVVRSSGAMWLLLVPFFEADCRVGGVDRWALLRFSPVRGHYYLDLTRFTVELPWEDDGRRQRGCVSGTEYRVRWPVCGG